MKIIMLFRSWYIFLLVSVLFLLHPHQACASNIRAGIDLNKPIEPADKNVNDDADNNNNNLHDIFTKVDSDGTIQIKAEDGLYGDDEGEDSDEEIFHTLILSTWGKPQLVEGSESEVALMKETANKMREYMTHEVLVEEEYEQVRSYCRNQNTLCLLWATYGECESNWDYMVVNCSPACMTCEELDKYFDVDAEDDEDDNTPDSPTPEAEKGESVAIPWGVPQNLGELIPHKVRALLRETEKYMKENVYVENEYNEVFGECQNRAEDCSHWAALGQCEKNPSYMKVFCAPACKSCEYLDFHIRCPVDPEALVTWSEPGDLNKFFERIVNDPYWEENHGPVSVISSPATGGPWVITIDNFLSDEEAARLVEIGYEEGFERSGDVGEPGADGIDLGVISDWRTSENTWCPDECRTDPVVGPAHDRVERLTGIPYLNWEWWQLLRYEAGEYYHEHNDYIYYEETRPQGPRILTGFFYLNDVKTGGGTRFTELNVTVMPKKGRAIFWPSVLDEEPMEMDERTNHEALVVEAGVKYGANVWFHQRDIKTPMRAECA